MKKLLLVSLIFLGFTNLLKAQSPTLTLSATPNPANSGADITFTVKGETAAYYVVNVTLNTGDSSFPSSVVLNPVTFGVGGGGASATKFTDQALFSSAGGSSAPVTFNFTLQVYNNSIGSYNYVTVTQTVTVVPPAAPPTTPPTTIPTGPLTNPLYRLNNTKSEHHFYTTSLTEENEVLSGNPPISTPSFWATLFGNTKGYWVTEGNMGYEYISQQSGSVAFQRFFNPKSGDHMYTIDPNEAASLSSSGWTSEGAIGYVFNTQVTGTTPLYRYNSAKGGHFFTTDINELGTNNKTWTYEGVSCYVLSAAH